jgi:hypothetical protein
MNCLLINLYFYFSLYPHPFRLLRSLALSLSQYNMKRLIPTKSLMNLKESLQIQMLRNHLPNKGRLQGRRKENHKTIASTV